MDGKIARRARSQIARQHFKALGIPLHGLNKSEIEALEHAGIALHPDLPWNGKRKLPTINLGQSVLDLLSGWTQTHLDALERQNERWHQMKDSNQ